ncbi:MAG: hypothetical protein ABIZ04_18600 [Opitutus sp.]
MNDFLTSLAARTLGQTPVIAPRLPSRFEPRVAASGFWFGETPRLVDQDDRGRGVSAEFLPVTPSPAGLRVPNVPSDVVANLSGSTGERHVQTQSPDSANGNKPMPEVNTASRVHARSGSTRIAAAQEGTRENPARFSIHAAQAIGSRAATGPSRVSSTRPETAPAPTIHVSIGRVEVRAIQRTENARPARTELQAKRLSLEDYLRQQRD